MPAPNRTLEKTYKRMRAVEETLVEALADALPDEAADEMAAVMGVPERGEALYDHPDYGVLLDLALHHHHVDGQTVIERHFDETKPAAGSDLFAVLSALMTSRFTLLRLGRREPPLGLQVEDLLFGGPLFLADPVLSKDRTTGEVVLATRLLAFDGFAMTPCTSSLDFDPELARILAAGLPAESSVPMAERYAAVEMRRELAVDLTHMALCSPATVKAALELRFSKVGRAPLP